ncbi:hypothetical protein [Oryzibacter oryziterrae]|uniref:hypothetical protein n=1 Tax=Oryzibacter oryziterrae TaxID=2766474 RepID=UPI001F2B3A3F|nr:hypothetical protein [Oryzibacter oryziterrae]
MTIKVGVQLCAADFSGRDLSAADVLDLRRQVYGDGVVQVRDAELLCDIDAVAGHTCQEWSEFFVEAITDFIVHQQIPTGYVSEDNASWLMARIQRDGIVKTTTELELLVKVIEAANRVPVALSAFALQQVAKAVIEAKGPLAARGHTEPGVIGKDDVALIRRILYAFGHEGSVGISREEAEVLFDLNDSTREADNDPAWSDLFVKAIANFLMASRGYSVLSRQDALRREAWLDAPSGGVTALFGDMLSTMLSNGLRGIWSAWRQEEGAWARRNRAVEEAARESEIVTSEEVKWLASRIGRDGVIHANERALLKFLSEESPDIHPSLRTLLDTAA